MGEMRALTVRPPWSHFIARCGKTVENRGYPTRYRGLLAIHAGAYSRWDASAEFSPVARKAWHDWAYIPARGTTCPLTRAATRDARLIDFGAVVAVAELDGCHGDCYSTCSPWAAAGQYHWNLFDTRPLARPVSCRGMLGLWRLPEDVEKLVREQLEEG
jgi:hypothetical protein